MPFIIDIDPSVNISNLPPDIVRRIAQLDPESFKSMQLANFMLMAHQPRRLPAGRTARTSLPLSGHGRRKMWPRVPATDQGDGHESKLVGPTTTCLQTAVTTVISTAVDSVLSPN
ncbi:hypothetical protein PRIPAC_90300 [Pristionchus pacificus]|uniref:Uncharacterized protein n=1 Tax=Pristionchus pacificus TaxID=54126 RepID=A0A2A6B661_PRIPA|nr:hypothetical protein PRIPAC_90300 [Pristionchus pacificus]|eukprot:PDM61362.1 hypothetical protein PRIPAC_50804 [Pristionchus pacificus]